MKQIVITGMGCISSLGHNVEEFNTKLFNGESGIGPITLFDASNFRAKVVAEVKNYDPTKFFSDKQLNLTDRYAQLALLSTCEAINDSHIQWDESTRSKTAVIFGTGISSQTTLDQLFYQLYGENNPRVHPFTVPKTMNGSAACLISMEYGITGPAFATASACSSAAHAIATAYMFIQSGIVDVVITGGAEAPISPGSIRGWEAIRVMSKDTCRPFSAKRSGMVIGEGAGTLILESLEHAKARGAKIYAELKGIGLTSDAHNMVLPLVDGPINAMKNALENADMNPNDIQYLNAHGTGTPQNDPIETQAIRAVFNGSSDRLAVSSTKSMHGHALGAAAALETIATISALNRQTAPPTLGYLGPDPKCDLDYVPNQARPMEIYSAMCNSFAFGGMNVSLLFKQYGEIN